MARLCRAHLARGSHVPPVRGSLKQTLGMHGTPLGRTAPGKTVACVKRFRFPKDEASAHLPAVTGYTLDKMKASHVESRKPATCIL
jgi:hypothetical protein